MRNNLKLTTGENMASIGNDQGGRRRILFVSSDGKRKTLRLGKCSKSDADEYKGRIEKIVQAAILKQAVDDSTSRWLAEREDKMHQRLAAVGLVKSREGGSAALGEFVDWFIASKPSTKQNTLENMKQVRQWLVKHFGESHDMREIRPKDADDWRAFMLKEGLGENTIRRHIGRARQLWKAAIRREIVRGANPFEGMDSTVGAGEREPVFITRDTATKELDACPDAQWRLMFALGRYGGLRCPSEHLALKWSDINWGDAEKPGTIRVPSSKTEHIKGKEFRIIPLFPELEKYLLDVQDEIPEGTPAEYVITRYRETNSNLRTQLHRIIRKAGLVPWHKPWHNLRSTRETELMETFPAHVVCEWIGNSLKIAQKHYLNVTDEHFKKAAQKTAQQLPEVVGNARKQSAETTQKAELIAISGDTLYPRQDSNL